MAEKLDTKRILIFLAFAFGISWASALIIFLTGGLTDSAELIPGTGITLALVLIASIYMFSPAAANVLTQLVTHEGKRDLYLRLHFRRGWRFWLAAWLLPVVLTVLGTAVFFSLFPRHFDPSLGAVRALLTAAEEQTGQSIPLSPIVFLLLQVVQALLVAPIINSLFTFGEEFGWRGYLQPKLLPLGGRQAMVLMGVIWGVWHWPIILMGHNYGLDYPGAPILGPLAMVWFTFVIGTFLGWATLRADSIWPAVIGHAVINGFAAIGSLLVQGEPNPVLGPLPVGIVGSLAWAAVAGWLLMRGNWEPPESVA